MLRGLTIIFEIIILIHFSWSCIIKTKDKACKENSWCQWESKDKYWQFCHQVNWSPHCVEYSFPLLLVKTSAVLDCWDNLLNNNL